MKAAFLFLFSFFLFQPSFSQISIEKFESLSNLSIRSLEVRNDSTVWFAANRGVWGYTENGGKNWYIDSIKVDTLYPEFRSMAVLNDSTVLLLNVSSPAFIFKTTNKGKTWKIVYTNTHKDIFFDSMKFWDDKNGIALADPIDGKIQLINTHDGGNNWKPVTEADLPVLEEGEAFFAASNTCFDFHNYQSWVVTGGKNARVLYSGNGGQTHSSFDTPLPEGEQMTGIYSIDFWDGRVGVIGGGNYDRADTSITAIAITGNGGRKWDKINLDQPVFGSCVQFLNRNAICITGKPGTFQYDLKSQTLTEIKDEKGESAGFHTLRVSPSGKIMWLAGANGKLGKVILK